MPARRVLTEDQVAEACRLYVEHRLSMAEIARRFHVSPTTVAKRLDGRVPKRTRPEYYRGPTKLFSKETVQEWADLYFNERLSSEKIGKRYYVSASTVRQYLHAAGYTLRTRGEANRIYGKNVKPIPPEEHDRLEFLYVVRKLSMAQIGDVLGIPEGTVRDRMRRAGIPVRSQSEANAARWTHFTSEERKAIVRRGWENSPPERRTQLADTMRDRAKQKGSVDPSELRSRTTEARALPVAA